MAEPRDKVMSAKEAISRFVHDGDQLIIGNYTVGSCAELVYEVIRQEKKGLTLYSQSGIFDVEVWLQRVLWIAWSPPTSCDQVARMADPR